MAERMALVPGSVDAVNRNAYTSRTSSPPAVPFRELQEEKDNIEKSLREDMSRRMKLSSEREKTFIVEDDLEAVWSDVSILTRLVTSEPWTEEEISFVRGNCIKVLSVLVWINASSCLPSYHDFFFSGVSPAITSTQYRDEKLLDIKDDDEDLASSFGGNQTTIKSFNMWRYCFSPAKIEEKGHHDTIRFEKRIRLPWAQKSQCIDVGGYSTVIKVVIPSHYLIQLDDKGDQVTNPQDQRVAIKQIGESKDFTQEVRNLAILKESITSHKNIIRHIGTFIHGDDCFILLPLALGDLEVFLDGGLDAKSGRKTEKPDIDPRLKHMINHAVKMDLILQAYLLADALNWLHTSISVADQPDLYCIHSDLKPGNVLIMNDNSSSVGRWKLSDFGLSVIHAQSGSQDTHVLTIGDAYRKLLSKGPSQRAPGTYQAPEVQLTTSSRVGRKSDVWSLACIFSEVLAFAIGGTTVLQEFQEARKAVGRTGTKDDMFYSPAESTLLNMDPNKMMHKVRPQVVEWLTQLPVRYIDRGDWVECCASLVLRSLVVDYNTRPAAERLESELWHAYQHIRDSSQHRGQDCRIGEPLSLLLGHDDSSAHGRREHTPQAPSLSTSLSSPKMRQWITLDESQPGSLVSRSLSEDTSNSFDRYEVTSDHSVHHVKLPKLRSHLIELALSVHGDRLAFLLRDEVLYYSLMPKKKLQHPVTLKLENKIKWTTIAVAGDYVIAAGNCPTSQSRKAVHVHNFGDPDRSFSIPRQYLDCAMRAVDITYDGRVMIVHPNRIAILNYDVNGQSYELEHELPVAEGHFYCAKFFRFSSSGLSVLAWSFGRGPERFYIWNYVSQHQIWSSDGETHYASTHQGEDYKVEPLPYRTHPGCIMMTSDRKFFSAHIDDQINNHNLAWKRITSLKDVKIAIVFRNSWLLTIEKRRRAPTLRKYPIIANKGKREIGSGEDLCVLKGPVDKKTSRMQIYHNDATVAVVILSKTGTVEWIPLAPT